jgi:hypothetical protein
MGTDRPLPAFRNWLGIKVAQMTSADQCRIKAVECAALALSQPHPHVRTEMQILAKVYRRLAELAELNSRTDIVYEPPFPRSELHH